MIAETTEVPIFVNGVLLSRRYITTESGVAITTADVNSVTLSVYRLICDGTAHSIREPVENYDAITIPVNSVILDEVEQDPDGNSYNFQYCVEGAFTASCASYCVEYTLAMADTHTVKIVIYARTGE